MKTLSYTGQMSRLLIEEERSRPPEHGQSVGQCRCRSAERAAWQIRRPDSSCHSPCCEPDARHTAASVQTDCWWAGRPPRCCTGNPHDTLSGTCINTGHCIR